MTHTSFDFPSIITKYDDILSRGLSEGIGTREGQMCIEAAVCAAMDLPHDDDPGCVSESVRSFKIALNDSTWTSPEARAKGLRNLGIAQIGSKDIVDDREFTSRLAKKTIQILIPTLLRQVFQDNKEGLDAALRCEMESSCDAAQAVWNLVFYEIKYTDGIPEKIESAGTAAGAACNAIEELNSTYSVLYVTDAVQCAVDATLNDPDKYLIMIAEIALEILKELKSPGCDWI